MAMLSTSSRNTGINILVDTAVYAGIGMALHSGELTNKLNLGDSIAFALADFLVRYGWVPEGIVSSLGGASSLFKRDIIINVVGFILASLNDSLLHHHSAKKAIFDNLLRNALNLPANYAVDYALGEF